ncbi:MAG TPA: RNA 2',3'-cyclic phosphodiesterase [Solirubrobacteraceae bacterium]|nr:RNA 2',3'-cyclic phosphodiesterase [Solirubrobacteraceae bacterium]
MSARLFIAADLPGAVREALADYGRSAAASDAALRAVGPGALHVTLAFLGHRALGEIEPLVGVVREAAAGREAPALSLSETLWLSPRRPSVLAVRLEDPSGGLAAIQAAAAERAANAVGFEAERRAFLPHVTVARVRRGHPPRRGGLPGLPGVDGFRAEAVTLYRSHLGGRGPARYEVVERVTLG